MVDWLMNLPLAIWAWTAAGSWVWWLLTGLVVAMWVARWTHQADFSWWTGWTLYAVAAFCLLFFALNVAGGNTDVSAYANWGDPRWYLTFALWFFHCAGEFGKWVRVGGGGEKAH